MVHHPFESSPRINKILPGITQSMPGSRINPLQREIDNKKGRLLTAFLQQRQLYGWGIIQIIGVRVTIQGVVRHGCDSMLLLAVLPPGGRSRCS